MRSSLPDSIGDIDAAFDRLLNADTFIKTSCYEEVLKDNNFIIIGRKGVGKTALAKRIPIIESKNPRWSHIHLAQSPDFHFNDVETDFKSDTLKNISSSEFMYHFWEHFIFENCMKIAHKRFFTGTYNNDEKIISEYLMARDLIDIDTISSMSAFLQGLFLLVAPALETGPISFTTGSGEKLKAFFDKKYNYSSAKSSLINILKKTKNNILFLIDNIDENIEESSKQNLVSDFTRQLLFVAREVNNGENLDKEERNPISVKAFIPTDVYSWLKLRHADKIRSYKYELKWNNNELKQMLQKRISALCKLGNMPYESIKRKYFDNFYGDDGRKSDAFTYMVSNTFGRPRDVINLYTHFSAELRKENKITSYTTHQIISDYISETIDTIKNEYAFVQPNLPDIFDGFHKSNSVCDWEYIRKIVANKGISSPVPVKDINDIIDRLYEIGMFGILIEQPNRTIQPIRSLRVEYCYDKRVNSVKRGVLVMHPIFRYEFLMKDNSEAYLKKLRMVKND